MTRFRRAVLAGAVAVAALAGSAVSAVAMPEAASATYRFTVLDFNMSGDARNDGRLGVANFVADKIRNRPMRPRIATLQEVCQNQARRIRNRLSDLGYHVYFVGTNKRCQNGAPYGNAVVYRWGADWKVQHLLPNPEGFWERRKIICVALKNSKIMGCSTHIHHRSPRTKRAQIKKVAEITERAVGNGQGVVTGGDFNRKPYHDAMDHMYRPAYGGGAHGIFTEGERCCYRGGEKTHDRRGKIDYIFLSKRDYWVDYGDTVFTSWSDHRLYWSRLKVR